MGEIIARDVEHPIPLTVPDTWAERIFESFPPDLARAAREQWMLVANTGPKYPGLRHAGLAPHAKANLRLGTLRRAIEEIGFPVAMRDVDIVETAFRFADLCSRINFSGERLAARFGIEVVRPKYSTVETMRSRFSEARWWRRKLRVYVRRAIEEVMRRYGLVRRGKAAYLTDWSLQGWRGQRAANQRMLDESVAVNEEGAELALSELVERSIANPEIRRMEMMLRARGFEEIAKAHGYTWTFATLTAPSAFHPQLEAGGENQRYEDYTVREAQQWLCTVWSRARAKLARQGIEIFGFRVAEPHHDGTPHWHMLLFVRPEQIDMLEETLRAHWLSQYADECGAKEYRVKFRRYDASRKGGSAAGYIAKYIGKNIDGHGVGEDFDSGLDGTSGAERVAAWASVHGIRQFQQIGGPAVGLWRELRRLRDPVEPGEIEAARVHTDRPASFSGFVDAAGGITAGRNTTLQLLKEEQAELNRYGEQRGPKTVGVRSEAHQIRTRVHEWKIERRECGKDRAESRRTSTPAIDARPPNRGCDRHATAHPMKTDLSGHQAAHTFTSGCRILRAPISSGLGPVSITVRATKPPNRPGNGPNAIGGVQ